MSEAYGITSRHYDASYAGARQADIPFYVKLARQQGSPVLEVACGTGRITLPIAREGIEITAVDISCPMLGVLREKLSREPEDVRQRVTVAQDDMRALRLPGRFRLVMIPFRPFQHMHTIDDQIAALSSARDHLADGGLLAFDVFMPRYDRIVGGVGEEVEDFRWETTEGGVKRTMQRSFIKDRVDPVTLTFEGRFVYRTFDEGTLIKEESEDLRMTAFTHPQLQLLFRTCGLQSVAEYGSFDEKPISPCCPEMIFILRKGCT